MQDPALVHAMGRSIFILFFLYSYPDPFSFKKIDDETKNHDCKLLPAV